MFINTSYHVLNYTNRMGKDGDVKKSPSPLAHKGRGEEGKVAIVLSPVSSRKEGETPSLSPVLMTESP